MHLDELAARLQRGLARANLVDSRGRKAGFLGGGASSGGRGASRDNDATAPDQDASVARPSDFGGGLSSADAAALFAGTPLPPTAAQRARAVDSLERHWCAAWRARLPAGAVRGARAELALRVKASLAAFAQQAWGGVVAAVHADSTLDVAMVAPADAGSDPGDAATRASSRASTSQSSRSSGNRRATAAAATAAAGAAPSGRVVAGLPFAAVAPAGRFERVPGVGRAWVGDGGALAAGSACTFRTATLLAPAEFLAAARCSPGSMF